MTIRNPSRRGAAARLQETRSMTIRFRTVPGAALLALLAACSDATAPSIDEPPTGQPPSVPNSVLYGTYYNAAQITCEVTMATLAVQCGSPQAPFGMTAPVGGLGNHTRLTPSSVTYNSGTQLFSMNVRLQNLLVQQMGTSDGTTITGLTPFFTLIQRTGGTGTVAVANADGTDTFTAPGQAYFHYPQKVSMLQQTSNKSWQFTIAPTVTTWRFRVYVSAETLPVIVFDKETGGNRDVWRVALDGTDLVQLSTHGSADIDPTSAQGRVAFVSYRNGQADLYWATLRNGGSLGRLTNTATNELAPAYDRQGVRLAYTRDQAGVAKLWWGDVLANGSLDAERTLNLATSPIGPGWIETGPTYLPTSTRDVLFTVTDGRGADIWKTVVGLSGNNPTRVISSTSADVEPVYNPAGTKIAFTSTRDGNPEIYEYNIATTVTTRLTNNAVYDGQPSYLPNGRIVYITEVASVRTMQWIDPGTLATGVIPTGAGTPRNPSVVPLY